MIPLPPRGQLAGFRDPYIFARGGGGRPWKMLLGSGVPGRGGTLLVYHAPMLTSGASAAQPFNTTSGGDNMLLLDTVPVFIAELCLRQAHRHALGLLEQVKLETTAGAEGQCGA